MNERHSITTATAGRTATTLTLVSCFWIGMLVLIREPLARAPIFTGLFWLVGLLMALGAIEQWRERLRAGCATLLLPQDPLPLGIPLNISVEFAQPPAAGEWRAKVRVTRQHHTEGIPLNHARSRPC